ncbi:MAG TPA: NUDIX domain-containing protein [Candidatus Saccharimonadales bacterium]|jgi:isopentenyl-diphosphate delta-isomerase type 1|nr:NUDIX domain-containing protein [Candidatus Saccharimonadales bacterium]
MAYPPVVVVDENDNEVGSAMLAEVLQKGLYHRIAAIFVEDDHGRMLLQLRGPDVSVYPNCWDQAAGGHVDEGQSYDQTAANEISEEIGLHNVALTTLGTYRANHQDGARTINQFERVYVAHVPHDVVLQPEAKEVSKLQWFTPAELKAQIAKHPEAFTPGLLYGLRKYFPGFAS